MISRMGIARAAANRGGLCFGLLDNDIGMLSRQRGLTSAQRRAFQNAPGSPAVSIRPGRGKEFAKSMRAVYFYTPLLETILWRKE
jgi:hypothetical protein